MTVSDAPLEKAQGPSETTSIPLVTQEAENVEYHAEEQKVEEEQENGDAGEDFVNQGKFFYSQCQFQCQPPYSFFIATDIRVFVRVHTLTLSTAIIQAYCNGKNQGRNGWESAIVLHQPRRQLLRLT
jgi:hypothetical protein